MFSVQNSQEIRIEQKTTIQKGLFISPVKFSQGFVKI